MKISLLHATARPKAAKECQKLWLESADNSANIEIITCVDNNDAASREAFPDAVLNHYEGVCSAWNEAAKNATGDVLVALDDDWTPPHGWDQIIESQMCNGADILHVGDAHRKDQLICHPIISKRFYDAMGYLWHPLFKSVYCDNWFSEVAQRWGYVDATDGGKVDLGFVHKNPSQGYGAEDEVARKSNSKERYEHGGAMLKKLQNQTILAFTVAGRKDYLTQTLNSWLGTDLSLVTAVHFFIEPIEVGEVTPIIDAFDAECPVPVIKHYNKEKLGVLRNPWHLFDHCFRIEGAKFVILGEDDFLVSPDVLNFLFSAEKNDTTMAACAKWVGKGSDNNPATWHRTTEFTGNIWGTWPDVWNKYLKDTWDFDYSSGKEDGSPAGWDWNLQLRVIPKNGLHCIVPTASRSKHIGVTGVHCTSEVFDDTVAWNFLSNPYEGVYREVAEQKNDKVLFAGAQYPVKGDAVTVSSSGDLGDCSASLATLVHRGNPTIYHLWDDGLTKGIVAREKFIRPFLESQPIIQEVRIGRPDECDWRSEDFRNRRLHDGVSNLATVHATHAKMFGFISDVPTFDGPWLTISGFNHHGKIVVNRSPRYNNNRFPWAKIVAHYGSRLVFMGLDEEYEAFRQFGEVARVKVSDMLEMARMIAGSSLFIGNQSVAMTIAEGLKHPRIQEVCLHLPDCIYPPSNAQYVANGAVILPGIDGSGELAISPEIPLPDGTETPPGGWQYDGLPKGMMHPNAAISMIRQQHPELTNAEAKRLLMEFNAKRVPEFFDKSALDSGLAKYRLAMRNNGHQI